MPQQNGVAGGGKVTPNLDPQGTRALNLTVLQRIDPAVEDILITAAHVSLYDFNIDANEWSRKDVEGSLFVVKRNTQPRFQLIVLNRRSTQNLVEDLLGDFEYELQAPYLLYRNASQEVNGIWFYNESDCQAVANLFGRILNAYAKVPQKPQLPSSSSEFEELEPLQTAAPIETQLESTLPNPPLLDVAEETLPQFFRAAVNVGAAPNAPVAAAHQYNDPVPFSIRPTVVPSSPTHQLSAPSASLMMDAPEKNSNANRPANLITPSLFTPASSTPPPISLPVSSALPSAPPLYPPPLCSAPHPYGTPVLQPFPPPNPPPSLAPTHSQGYIISKDRVREALMRLVQNENFIDLVYREMQNANM